jgi:hypothetical protein
MPLPIPCTDTANCTRLSTLDGYLGKSVNDWCGKYGSVGDDDNHCAHFVSHVLSLRIPGAALCSNVGESTYTYAQRHEGFCVRVNQIFNNCQGRAAWNGAFDTASGCYFVVATIAANVTNQSPPTVGTMRKKHIGFFTCGMVYHYSNGRDKVIMVPLSEFKRHYGGRTLLFRADLP